MAGCGMAAALGWCAGKPVLVTGWLVCTGPGTGGVEFIAEFVSLSSGENISWTSWMVPGGGGPGEDA